MRQKETNMTSPTDPNKSATCELSSVRKELAIANRELDFQSGVILAQNEEIEKMRAELCDLKGVPTRVIHMGNKSVPTRVIHMDKWKKLGGSDE